MLLTRKIVKDGSKYYGPFTDVGRLRMTLKALHKVFPIRSCSFYLDEQVVKEKKVSICLDYHIKKCEGPCEGLVSQDDYQEMVDRIEDFMKGKTKKTESHIVELMNQASINQQYEEAAMYRDQLDAIRSFKERQSHVATDFEERDVIALAREDNLGIAVIIRIRNGRIFSREKLSLQGLDENDDATLKTVISRFYMDSDFIPKEISLQLHSKTGKPNPTKVVACVGGGSNAAGSFYYFYDDVNIELYAVEAAGQGLDSGKSAATSFLGLPGVLHGSMTLLLQDQFGQVTEPYSISAGLDYPGIGPIHAFSIDSGRTKCIAVTDKEVLVAARELALSEGIIPALESAHALAALHKIKFTKDDVVVLNLSGRGDKDIQTYQDYLKANKNV